MTADRKRMTNPWFLRFDFEAAILGNAQAQNLTLNSTPNSRG
jgi:hypothetical protein